MARYLTLKNIAASTTNEQIARAGNVVVRGRYSGDESTEVTVERVATSDVRALAQFGKVRRCERVTLFGVGHAVKNRDISRMCNVNIVGDHLCGNHYDNTKDITVEVRNDTDLSLLARFCQKWKAVSPDPIPAKPRDREADIAVLMLQVVLPPTAELSEKDKQEILRQYLRQTRQSSIKCSGAGTKPRRPKHKKHQQAQTKVYTFYIRCTREAAAGYIDLNKPLLDAFPYRTVAGVVVHLNTIQLCNKPDVYNNGSQYSVGRQAACGPESESGSGSCKSVCGSSEDALSDKVSEPCTDKGAELHGSDMKCDLEAHTTGSEGGESADTSQLMKLFGKAYRYDPYSAECPQIDL
eukprot:TRINITY_DN20968_c0_g1_i1.p1 TRINITY_DN20968_c0_g1~~TRINITY_DN20968_c0_g1_i1.p1  ORF type:complete len:352 (+),score=97.32 TRINITY_DN20968_c0_g1_i1:37-1092(+)